MTKALTINKIVFLVSFFIFLIFIISSPGNTPYDYFTRLADSFLHGKIYLIDNPPWLNELIPAGKEKYFVAYPPMPAIISMPFVFVFGKQFPQTLIAEIIGAGIAFVQMKIAYVVSKNIKTTIWTGVLTGLGTIVWFLASTGSSWYIGQLTSALFMSLALYESLHKKRPLLIGFFAGASYLSRIHTILAFPILILIALPKKKRLKFITLACIGSAPFLFFNFYYNYIRFGVVWDKAYTLIPGVLSEPWYNKGIFNISYLPRHIKIAFLRLPEFRNKFPFMFPTWEGLAIWFTTPAFLYAFRANFKNKINVLSTAAILFIFIPILLHGTTGFAQFGYRFAVDFYPFLILLVINSVNKSSLRLYHWAILIICIFVNAWGVLFINHFGWINP